MALKVGELFATINLRDEGFNSGLSSAMSSLAKATATAVATMKVFDTLKLGVNYNADIEQLQTGFEVMTGSAEKAAAIVSEIRTLGAQTPFEMTGLAETTQLLMNYGLTADNAIDSMLMLGDVAQGDQTKLTRIATAFGQMSSAGKVQLQDIKQMIEAGYNPLQEISESTGESMASLYDRISKGTISVDEITASMKRSTSAGGKYFKSMEKQSKTLNGQISTLQDNLMQLLGSAVQPISDVLRDSVLPTAIDVVEQIQAAFDEDGFAGIGDLVAKTITQSLRRIRTEAAPAIRSAFEKLWSAARGSGTALKDNLEMVIQNAPEYVRSAAKRVKGSFANIDWNGIWNGIQNSAEHLRISINNVLVRSPIFLKQAVMSAKTKFKNINWCELWTGIEKSAEHLRIRLNNLLTRIPVFVKTGIALGKSKFAEIDWAGIWDGISNTYDSIKSNIAEMVKKVPEAINSLLRKGSDFVESGTFADIGTEISNLIAKSISKGSQNYVVIASAIKDIFSGIEWEELANLTKPIGESLLKGISLGFLDMTKEFAKLINLSGDALGSITQNEELENTLNSLGKSLVTSFTIAINSVSDAGNQILNAVAGVIGSIDWGNVGTALGSFARNFISNLASSIAKEDGTSIMEGIGTALGSGAAGLVNFAGSVLREITYALGDPQLYASVIKLGAKLNYAFWDGFFTAARTYFANLDFVKNIQSFMGWDETDLPKSQPLPTLMEPTKQDRKKLSGAGRFTETIEIPTELKPQLTSENLETELQAVVEKYTTEPIGLEPSVEVSSVQAATLGEEAKAQFGTAGTEAGNILNQNAATAIANTAGIEGAIATLSAAASSAASSGFRTAGMTGGKMFSSGLVAGILSGKSAITSAARKVAQAAIDAANAKLKIASPSRVMMESGGYFSEGFAKGIMNAAKMATSAASGMAGMAASAATIRRPVGGLSYAGATVSGGAAVIDYDKMAEAMSQYQMAMYMNGRRVAEINAANTARAQNNRQNSIALGYGINRR